MCSPSPLPNPTTPLQYAQQQYDPNGGAMQYDASMQQYAAYGQQQYQAQPHQQQQQQGYYASQTYQQQVLGVAYYTVCA